MRTQETFFERFEYKYWVTHEMAEELLRITAGGASSVVGT